MYPNAFNLFKGFETSQFQQRVEPHGHPNAFNLFKGFETATFASCKLKVRVPECL